MLDAGKVAQRGGVEIANVCKSYGGTPALIDINLSVRPGEFLSLLGPSGCGKTTLLRCIAGLVSVDDGDIRVDSRSLLSVAPWKRDVSVVFQSYALFPHMTVAENVAFGLRMRRISSGSVKRRVEDALGMVHMADFAGRMPSQLSGGQQQRVALARAIVVEPTVLLLDEPLAALDAKLRGSVQIEIRNLQARLGITTILVTHDQEEAMSMSDRIAVMNRGYIEQVATPADLYAHPSTPFVADFVGQINRLHGTIRSVDGAARFFLDAPEPIALGLPPSGRPEPGSATLMLRPENVLVRDAPVAGHDSIEGTVENTVLVGDRYALYVRAQGSVMRATMLNDADSGAKVPAPGARVALSWKSEHSLVFPGVV